MSTPNDAVRSNPSLSANSSSILLNGRLHAARYTAASPGFAQRGWYLGTSGVGLLFFDEGAPLPQRLIFGLPGDDIGALYEAPGGMWVVNQPTATSDAGLSFVANDLSEFRWFQGPGTRGYPFTQARRLVGIQRSLWAATDVGLVRFDAATGDYDVLDEGAGLPDRRVLDIAVRRGRIAVGTMRGVIVFDDSLKVTRLAPSFTDAIRAVALSGDTVWVGTDVGLAIAVPGADNLLQPEALRESPSLQAPVVSLVWDGETLVALTDDRLMWRNPQTGAFQLGASLSGALGRLHMLLPYRDGFWVAGDRGVGFARRNSPVVRPIQTPGDLPAPVTSLAIDDTYLWVGTRLGLVRFRLDAVGP
jgi:hypothetical protein